MESGFTPCRRLRQVPFLLLGDCADLPATASIRREELRGYHRGAWPGCDGRGGFVRQEGGDEAVLEGRGVGVGGQVGEVEVAEEHYACM